MQILSEIRLFLLENKQTKKKTKRIGIIFN